MVQRRNKYSIKKGKSPFGNDGYYLYKNGKRMKDTFAFSKRDALRQLGSIKRLEEFTIKYKTYPANKNKMEQVVLPIKNIKTAKTFNLRYKKKKSKIGFENQFSEWV